MVGCCCLSRAEGGGVLPAQGSGICCLPKAESGPWDLLPAQGTTVFLPEQGKGPTRDLQSVILSSRCHSQ